VLLAMIAVGLLVWALAVKSDRDSTQNELDSAQQELTSTEQELDKTKRQAQATPTPADEGGGAGDTLVAARAGLRRRSRSTTT
jgi:hypothetical protein